jgi:hypothetical protein
LEGGKPRVPNYWDSRVAEAKEILQNPWSIFTTGFLFMGIFLQRRDVYEFREIMQILSRF